MSQTPIISAHQLREYVRKQNVAPEAAPALKLMMDAAAQIDQLASAAVKWTDQSGRIVELEDQLAKAAPADLLEQVRAAIGAEGLPLKAPGLIAAVREIAESNNAATSRLRELEETDEDLPGEQYPGTPVNFRQLVDELCVHFGIERYDELKPRMIGLQKFASEGDLALRERDATIETLDKELVESKAAHMQAKEDYARLHQLLDQICEASTIPDVRFNQLPAAAAKFAELFNATLDAAGVDGQDADDLPQEVRKYVKLADENKGAALWLEQEKVAHQQTLKLWTDLKGEQNRIAMALGLTAPTVQEVLDAISELYGSDNVTAPAVDASWLNDVIDLCHAVAGDLSRENVIMARAARSLIQTAPRGEHE